MAGPLLPVRRPHPQACHPDIGLGMPAIAAGPHVRSVQEIIVALNAQERTQSVYTAIAKESGIRSESAQVWSRLWNCVANSDAVRDLIEGAERIRHLEHDKRSLIQALVEILNSAAQPEHLQSARDLLATVSSVLRTLHNSSNLMCLDFQ